MKDYETVLKAFVKEGIEFLIVGGFAVNAYGYSRHTVDLDLMIVIEDLNRVRGLMTTNGFTNIVIKEAAAHFFKPDETCRIDFLMANHATIATLVADAKAISIFGVQVKVPHLEHLIAMKLHALKYAFAQRVEKDVSDIIALMFANELSISRIQKLCHEFSTPEVLSEIKRRYQNSKI